MAITTPNPHGRDRDYAVVDVSISFTSTICIPVPAKKVCPPVAPAPTRVGGIILFNLVRGHTKRAEENDARHVVP
jgi:hypothetical protein